jgi:glycosyltransferase involved in cell wall biosynthesis
MDVARGQIAAGHQVGIFCDSTTGGERADNALRIIEPDLALGLRRVAMTRNPSLVDWRAFQAMRAFRRDANPDIIHGHGSKGGVYARSPAFLEKRWPVRCYTPHGGSFNYFPGTLTHKIYMVAERILARRTSIFLMESVFIAARARAAIGKTNVPLRVVHNGITDAEFEPVPTGHETCDVLYLGELRFAKGIDTLLDAVTAVAREGLRIRLLIVGSGPDEMLLRERVQKLGLCEQVTWEPPGPIRSALARSRLMVVPSRAESLPYVILEAAAAREPLVSTNVGGIPEIFGPYANRLIPPDDSEALAAALMSALSSTEEELQEEAEALAAYVRANFSYDAMVAGVIAGYRAALKSYASHQG